MKIIPRPSSVVGANDRAATLCTKQLAGKGILSCLPAARLLSTALLVYSEAHTSLTALPRAVGSWAGMPAMDSYSPAPDMPARSSTLADDLAMRVASAGKLLPAQWVLFRAPFQPGKLNGHPRMSYSVIFWQGHMPWQKGFHASEQDTPSVFPPSKSFRTTCCPCILLPLLRPSQACKSNGLTCLLQHSVLQRDAADERLQRSACAIQRAALQPR